MARRSSTRKSIATAPRPAVVIPVYSSTPSRPLRSSRNNKANDSSVKTTIDDSDDDFHDALSSLPASPAVVKKQQKTRSVSSVASSVQDSTFSRDVSVDTPDTSNITTPAEPTKTTGKRKRQASALRYAGSADTLDDEKLAQQLQQQEYDGADTIVVADSDDEEDDSFVSDNDDFEMDDEDDEPLAKRSRLISKKGKEKATPPARRRRPARQARQSAEKAIKAKVNFSIGDSEAEEDQDAYNVTATEDELFAESDLSELSDLASDAEMPALDDLSDADIDKLQGDVVRAYRLSRARGKAKMTDKKQLAVYNDTAKRTGLSGRSLMERIRLEHVHPEIVTLWDDLATVPLIPTEAAEQPSHISRKLKAFQLEGLNWLRKQEQTRWKGGLLGDEMGMGKTIQAVSLIMSDYPQKQPTLVVVPPVALMQWTNEIKEYTNGTLKVLVYHGTNAKAKKMTVKELSGYDVIMISYSGLESIHRKETKGWTRGDNIVKEDSAIHSIHYHRLILDEAHSIKSRTTGVAKACFALKGTYKWCLSGTPVQNRIGEFFSLMRFLEITPYANYFCKSCDCSALHWAVDANYRCKSCNHRGLDHVSVFNQEILNPITQATEQHIRKAAFAKLRLLTDRIMLRRMKRDHTASMELPPKEIIIHNEFFGEIERDFAGSIMNNTARQFDTYVSRGVMLDNYANIFGLIMQMRQVADHPDLILRKHAEGGQNVMVCNLCDEPCEDAVRSRCKHDFCRSCIKEYIQSADVAAEAACPRCHINLSIDLDQPEIEQDEESVKKTSIINRIKMENWTSSTKIEMLVYDLWKLRSKKQTTKSIVFSQFTSMLQLIEWRLRRAGFNTVMLDGSMTPQQRQKSIEYFMTEPEVEVFLVSLKAGGVALNLTEASRVFIVDPWWNPAAEWQSADRCHRIGQRRPCVITRLCVEDSIESRIVMLQEKKAQMINGTVNNDDVAMEKLTPADMQFLFRGS